MADKIEFEWDDNCGEARVGGETYRMAVTKCVVPYNGYAYTVNRGFTRAEVIGSGHSLHTEWESKRKCEAAVRQHVEKS